MCAPYLFISVSLILTETTATPRSHIIMRDKLEANSTILELLPPSTASIYTAAVSNRTQANPLVFLEAAKAVDGDKSPKTKKVFFHYVVQPDRAHEDIKLREMYLSNLEAVLRSMIEGVFYKFSIVGEEASNIARPTLERYLAMHGPDQLTIEEVDNEGGDLCLHKRAIDMLKQSERGDMYDMYVFGNDGARLVGGAEWVRKFREIFLRPVVAIAGPIVSCQGMSPHVQTHLFAVNDLGLPYLMRRSCDTPNMSHEELVYQEIRLSAEILQDGMQIASMLPELAGKAFHIPSWANLAEGVDVRIPSPGVQPESPCLGFDNPSACIRGDPRSIFFIKWGGNQYKENMLPNCNNLESPYPHCEPALEVGAVRDGSQACTRAYAV